MLMVRTSVDESATSQLMVRIPALIARDTVALITRVLVTSKAVSAVIVRVLA